MQIKLSGICKGFIKDELHYKVLKSINLDLKPGANVCLSGPSGSGKSTLLAVIGMLTQPDSGSYLLDGVEVFGLSSAELAKFRMEKIGYIFQHSHLIGHLNAMNNVALPLIYQGKNLSEAQDIASATLRHFQLDHRLTNFPRELSGGERQRVMIARAIVKKPLLILADEPTSALDSENKHLVMQSIKEYCKENFATLVVATHDRDLIDDFHRVIKM